MSQNKKNKKANAFLMFMLDYKRNAGNEMDMNQAQLEAGALWMVRLGFTWFLESISQC